MPVLEEIEVKNSIVLGVAIFSFVISEYIIYTLSGGTNVIIAHLLYFPIILASFKWPKQAIFISVGIGAAYLGSVVIAVPDNLEIIPAITQFYVYISIAVVVSALSLKMKEHEIRYHNVFHNSGNGICILHPKSGEVIEENEQCASLFEGESLKAVWEKNGDWNAFIETVRQNGSVSDIELNFTLPGMGKRSLLIFASTLPDGELVINLSDITERKNAEKKIQEREQLFQSIANTMLDASVIIDYNGTILFSNPASGEMAGVASAKDLLGRSIFDFVHPDYRDYIAIKIGSLQNESGGVLTELPLLSDDDSEKWIEGLGTGITFKGSEAIILSLRDITERRLNEQGKTVQRDLGLALASTSSVEHAAELCMDAAIQVSEVDCGGIYIIDRQTGDFVLKYAKNFSDDFIPRVQNFSRTSDMASVAEGKSYYAHYPLSGDIGQSNQGPKGIGNIPIMDKNGVIGSIYIASHTKSEIPPRSRTILEMIAMQIGNAITRIQAEESINNSKKDLQMLFDSLDDFIFVNDDQGHIIHTNRVVSDRFGYSCEELNSMNVLDMHPPDTRAEATTIMRDLFSGKRNSCPLPMVTKDGELIDVETKVTSGRWGHREVFFGVSRDITERKRAEDALKRRDLILDAVSYAAERFLSGTKWEEHIGDVLMRLGEATGASRSYIIENSSPADSDASSTPYRFLWKAEGIEPDNAESKSNPAFLEFTRWYEQLSAGNPVAGDVRDFPEEERLHLESRGISSLALIPVFIDSDWWGYLRFDNSASRREWTQTEIEALHAAGSIIGSAIQRSVMDEVFRNPIEKSLVGTYLIQDGIFHYMNPRGAEIFGYERDELMGKPIDTFIHPDDLALVQENIRQRITGEIDSAHYEFRSFSKLGNEIVLEAYGTVIPYKGRNAIVGTIMDITGRMQVERDNTINRERLELALRGANLGLFDWCVDTGRLVINERWVRMLGRQHDNFEPHIDAWMRLIHPDDKEYFMEVLNAHLEGRTAVFSSEYRMLAASGEWKWILARGMVVQRNEESKPLRMTGTHLDITERKKAEERIDHLHRVILAVRNVNELIIRVKDADVLIQKACNTLIENRGYHSAWITLLDDENRLSRYAEAGLGDQIIPMIEQMRLGELSSCIRKTLTTEDILTIRNPTIKCADSPIAQHYEGFGLLLVQLRHEGERYGILGIALPRELVSDDEEIGVFREVAGDISFALHSIRLEEEQRQTNRQLRIKDNAMASSINGIAIFDLNGNLTYVNSSFLDMWGYTTEEEVLGRPVGDYILSRQEGVDLFSALYEKGWWIGEITASKKDGEVFLGLAHASLVKDELNRPICMMSTVVDMTEKKRAEDALRDSEEKYRGIFENARIGILVAQDGKVKYANPALGRLLEPFHASFLEAIHPEDREMVMENYNNIVSGDDTAGVFACRMRKPDQEDLIWLELHAFRFNWEGRDAVLSFIIDVTDRKEYEEQIQASLDEKSVLIMEIHHRVKNNLQIVSGLIKLQSRYIEDPVAQDYLRECENRIITMALVHESLYQSDNLAQINAREHFRNLATNLLRSDSYSSHISLDIDIDDISLNLDTAIPCSLIINELVTNSIKYAFNGRDAGTVCIDLHRDDDGLFTLIVGDDGVGIPGDFDINFSKSLGLKLVNRLLKSQLRGTLDVEKENGTRFVMTFEEKNTS